MTDYSELRRLAEAATDGAEGIFNRRTWEFRQAANPATVLELLGDLSNWQNNSHCMGEEINEWKARAEAAEGERDAALLEVAAHGRLEPSGVRRIFSDLFARAEAAEAKVARLTHAICAIGANPEGYCWCNESRRDATKPEQDHTGECRELRGLMGGSDG